MNTSPFAEAIAAQETAREGWMTPKFQRTTDAAFTVTTMCEGLRVCHENFAQALEQESNDKDAEIDRLKKELVDLSLIGHSILKAHNISTVDWRAMRLLETALTSQRQ